jgi:hypothetical protein
MRAFVFYSRCLSVPYTRRVRYMVLVITATKSVSIPNWWIKLEKTIFLYFCHVSRGLISGVRRSISGRCKDSSRHCCVKAGSGTHQSPALHATGGLPSWSFLSRSRIVKRCLLSLMFSWQSCSRPGTWWIIEKGSLACVHPLEISLPSKQPCYSSFIDLTGSKEES